jgi:hypothetical protein
LPHLNPLISVQVNLCFIDPLEILISQTFAEYVLEFSKLIDRDVDKILRYGLSFLSVFLMHSILALELHEERSMIEAAINCYFMLISL